MFDGDTVAEMRGISVNALRRQVQMVFQDSYSSLNPRMPVRDIGRRSVLLFMEGKAAARDIARVPCCRGSA